MCLMLFQILRKKCQQVVHRNGDGAIMEIFEKDGLALLKFEDSHQVEVIAGVCGLDDWTDVEGSYLDSENHC